MCLRLKLTTLQYCSFFANINKIKVLKKDEVTANTSVGVTTNVCQSDRPSKDYGYQ